MAEGQTDEGASVDSTGCFSIQPPPPGPPGPPPPLKGKVFFILRMQRAPRQMRRARALFA